jgi:hypothetical protein
MEKKLFVGKVFGKKSVVEEMLITDKGENGRREEH